MTTTPPKRPRGRPRNEELTARRREEILHAAAHLFAERGYAGLDVQAVADALGIGKGTVYRYFPTKDALFLAAVDRGIRQLSEVIDNTVRQHADPLDQIRYSIQTYLAYFAENPDLVELLIQERAQFRDRQRPTYFVHRDRNIGKWIELTRGLIATGRFRHLEAERVCQVFGDLLYGTMFTNYFTGRPVSPEAQTADILAVTFRGILSDDERKRET